MTTPVYDLVLIALMQSAGNDCVAVSDALRAAADFALMMQTHRDAEAFSTCARDAFALSSYEGMLT